MSSNPTLGPAVFNKHDGGPYHGNITVYRGKNEIGVQQVRTVAVVLPYASADENDANAALIAEAFNVHHETGLTPQQMREQRDELLAALRSADQWIKLLCDEIGVEPSDTEVTVSANGPDGKRELAKLNLAKSQAQFAAAIAKVEQPK